MNGLTTFSIITLSIMTLSIMTVSITLNKNAKLCIITLDAKSSYAECRKMPFTPCVLLLNVIMLSVVAPNEWE
jgi:hypothetical protein